MMKLTLLCGPPGVGKTTAGRELPGDQIRTDLIRKRLFDDPSYSAAETRLVYKEMHRRMVDHLSRAKDVVLDGTYRQRADRQATRKFAEINNVPFAIVWIRCDDETVEERLEERDGDASDADYDVYQSVADSFEQPVLSHDYIFEIDNSGSSERTAEQTDEVEWWTG